MQVGTVSNTVNPAANLEPLFLTEDLFERVNDPAEWTTFECEVLLLLMNSQSANNLTFIQKVALVEAMRVAGVLMLNEIEDRRV